MIGQALLQLGTVAVLSRLLSPADFGRVAVALAIVGIAQIIAQFGVGPALVQRSSVKLEHVHAAGVVATAASLVLCAVMALSANQLALLVNVPHSAGDIRWIALVLPIRALGTGAEAMLQRDLAFRELSKIDLSSTLFGSTAVSVSCAFLGVGAFSLVAGQLAAATLRTALLLRSTPGSLGLQRNERAYIRIVRFGSGMSTAQVAHAFAVNVDSLIVSQHLGSAAVGIFNRAYQLVVMPASLISNSVDRVLFPVLARISPSAQESQRALSVSFRAAAVLGAAASIVLFALSPEIVSTILGKQWEAAVTPLRIFSIGLFFRVSFQLGDAYARAAGEVWASARIQIAYAVTVIAAVSVGVRFGPSGAAGGVLAAMILKYVISSRFVLIRSRLSLTTLVAQVVPGVCLALWIALGLLPALFAVRATTLPAPLVLLFGSLVAILLAGAALLTFPRRLVGQVILESVSTLPVPRLVRQLLLRDLSHPRL